MTQEILNFDYISENILENNNKPEQDNILIRSKLEKIHDFQDIPSPMEYPSVLGNLKSLYDSLKSEELSKKYSKLGFHDIFYTPKPDLDIKYEIEIQEDSPYDHILDFFKNIIYKK